jgi:hypothetical protein
MELNAIEMDRTEARKAFLAYREALRQQRNEEDAALMRGYRELANGRQILHLPTVLAGAGLDAKKRPLLAVARADAKRITLNLKADGSAEFYESARRLSTYLRLPAGTFPADADWRHWHHAVVPLIPAHLRPPHALTNYHILWEADWERVPRDPALLKDLGSGLFAVLAVWDLTELERMVLGVTRRALPR